MAAGQNMRPQKHQGARRLLRQRLTDAGAVAADQIELQDVEPVVGDADVLEKAEAGVHSVHLPVGREDPRDHRVAALEPRPRGPAQGHAGAAPGNRRDLLQFEMLAVEDDGGGHGRVVPSRAKTR